MTETFASFYNTQKEQNLFSQIFHCIFCLILIDVWPILQNFQVKAPAYSVDFAYDGNDIKIFGAQSLKSELCGLCGSFNQVISMACLTIKLINFNWTKRSNLL